MRVCVRVADEKNGIAQRASVWVLLSYCIDGKATASWLMHSTVPRLLTADDTLGGKAAERKFLHTHTLLVRRNTLCAHLHLPRDGILPRDVCAQGLFYRGHLWPRT